MIDKEKAAKLQKKLEQRKLTIVEALQEEIVLDWLKTSNPAFLSMLTPEVTIEIISLLINEGPPNDKIRSFKIPMIAAELLSIMTPKVYQILFQEDPQDHGSPVIARLFKYFDGSSNYVISGYVARIILNLFPANPSRVLEFILKSHPQKILSFVESHSIAELVTRIIIVEDALLNVHIKERVALLSKVVEKYVDNKEEEDRLANLNWILGQAINRLWSLKHKELGRFSGTLFQLVEAVIDKNNLYQQEAMMIAVCKQVAVYQKEAPFLIAALYKKIHQELALGKSESLTNPKPKLTIKRFRYLQALYLIIVIGSVALVTLCPTNNVFSIIIDFVFRYQWHSLALIEIEKILKVAFHSPSESIFVALSRSYIPDKIKQLGRLQLSEGKNGCGFTGILGQIATVLKESLDEQTGYGGWLKKTQSVGDLDSWLNDFLDKKKEGEQHMKVVHEVAKPYYHINKIPEVFKEFFDETEAINARLLRQSPSKHQKEKKEVLQQIENENELVYKWMSEYTGEGEQKKSEEALE